MRFLLSASLYLGLLPSAGFAQSPSVAQCPDFNAVTQGTASGQAEQPENGPQFRLTSVTFIGETALDPKELSDIASSLEKRVYQGPRWTNEVAERARSEWQNRGYFWATMQSADARQLSETPNEKRFWLTISVTARPRYRLAGILFQGNSVFSSSELRTMFPIEDGAILEVEKIRKGLESFRRAYSQRGFVEAQTVPNFVTDNASSVISLTLEVDEGKKFVFNDIKIMGLEPQLAQNLLRQAGVEQGKTFNPRLLDEFVQRNQSLLPQNANAETDTVRKWNDSEGTVDITMDFRRCPIPQ